MSCLKDHAPQIHEIAEEWQMGDPILVGHIRGGAITPNAKPRVMICASRFEAMYFVVEIMEMMDIAPSRLLEIWEKKQEWIRAHDTPEDALRQIKDLLNQKDDEC